MSHQNKIFIVVFLTAAVCFLPSGFTESNRAWLYDGPLSQTKAKRIEIEEERVNAEENVRQSERAEASRKERAKTDRDENRSRAQKAEAEKRSGFLRKTYEKAKQKVKSWFTP